jgi:hypothetical protein
VALAELRQQRQPNAGLCQQRARGCAEAARNAQGANNDDCWFFAAPQQKKMGVAVFIPIIRLMLHCNIGLGSRFGVATIPVTSLFGEFL